MTQHSGGEKNAVHKYAILLTAALQSSYQDSGTAANKGRSKRGVSRASEVLALMALVTRSTEREGGDGQKILYAQGCNLYKSVFVSGT